jgi:class 3 adenylate cyclase/tetratricopeptide (TPR) repeat protein
MKCPRCQQESPATAKFCNTCGARLDVCCQRCGQPNPPGSRFCNECGKPVEVAGAQGPALRFTAPENYTPKQLAEKILTSRSGLEGERKQVTVLFADLRGSMELLADRDPEEARKLLDPFLERMMEAVHRYEGTVNQVMGDGIMALFGAPVAHEDHGVRACYAALDMQTAIRRCADEVWRTHGIKAQIRVGLNSGEVVVRAIGSDLQMDYTAVGRTTHLAARMEQLATPGTVLITADTFRLAEEYITVKPLGPVPVKGLEAPIEIYELTGVGPLRSQLHAAAGRELTRFVGREQELEKLRQALGRASDGHGQIVGVVGEPGIGKTRLFYEFTHSRHTQGWLLLETWSVSYGRGTAYLPILDLLKTYFQLEVRDDARSMREKVTGKLLTLDPILQTTLPAFLALLDVPREDPQWQALDPSQRRRQTLDALNRLVLRESEVQPVCLVVENLHWIDSETQAFLDGLVESLPATRLLLLVNSRPEYQHPWGNRTFYTQLRLDPLPLESAEQLLGALLGSDASLDPLKRLLTARAEGNPFFLEENVRSLVETQVLVGERGVYRLARPLRGVQVPATVQAVLAARIDRLPPEDKGLLQTASVVGKDVPFVLLQAITEQGEEELRVAIGRLQAAEFLYETRLFPDLEYTFKHALTHEVAYGSLLQDRRCALHGRIVEAVERLYADRLAEHVERLAQHAFRAEAWVKAALYLRQAGARAAGRSAHREAVTLFEKALTAFRHLPETRETLEDAIDLRFDLRASLTPLGEHEKAFEYLREAEKACATLDDPQRLGQVYDQMSYYFFLTGRLAAARTFGQRALTIADTVGDLSLQVTASLGLGLTEVASGEHVGGEQFLRRVVQLLAGALSRERCGQAGFPSVLSRSWLAWSLAERGEFSEGMTHGQEAVRIAEAIAQPYSLIAANWRLGHLYGVKGEYSQAIHLLERGLALSREWNIPAYAPGVSSSLGHVYALSGRVPEGLTLLEHALTGYESMGMRVLHSRAAAHLGEAYLLADRRQDAYAVTIRAVKLAHEGGERGAEAHALRLLGEIAYGSDPAKIEAAEGYYRQAIALSEECEMRPLVAKCRLGLGRLYRRAGKPPHAQEHLAVAMRMFRKMDMGFWLERAEAEVKASG